MDTTHSLQARLWQEVTLLSLALGSVLGILLWPTLEAGCLPFFLSLWAGVSGLLLAMSFSLSGFSYYFDFLDDKVVYRKQLGLMGYFFAVGYAVLAVIAHPALYISAFPQNLFTIEVGLGAAAMAILTLMALVSNAKAMQWLGGQLWKNILGLGYVAYALLVIRALFLDAFLWHTWFTESEAVLSVRMALTVLGTCVLLLRASVPFHKKYFNKTNYV